MTVAVTGASGHVGGNLVREIIKQGRKVRVLARQDRRAFEGLNVEIVEGDVLDKKSLLRLFDGAESAFHLAARISIIGDQGGLVEETNHKGTCNVLDACMETGVKRLVHFSSIHAYHTNPKQKEISETRELAAGKDSMAYDRSKAMGQMAVIKAAERGLNAVVVNPTAVLGPYDYKPSRMGQVILDLYHHKLPALIDAGYNWVDVRDVVAGALAAEKLGRTGESYLLAGRWEHFGKLAQLVNKFTGEKIPKMATPLWLASFAAPFALYWSKISGTMPKLTPESVRVLRGHRYISHEKANKEFGYNPRPLEETVRDTLDWFRQSGMLK